MSILLDALKKSEEERQLGKAPGVHAPADHDPEGGDRGGRPLVPVLLFIVAAILVGSFAWKQFRAPADLPETVEVTEAVTAAPATAQQPTPPAAADNAAPAPSPVASYTAPEQAPDQVPAQASSQSSGTAATDAEQSRADVARRFNEFEAPAEPPAAESGMPPPDATGRADDTDASRMAARPEPAREAATPSNRPVSFWELPQNVRDSMPELKITVMVYAEQPADRFLLLNGRRVVEGDSLEGLRLEEIQRDGAIFSYRNYQFRIED